MNTTHDRFLDGRLTVEQPAGGYRAATDPVILAACVPAKSGDTVLDVGCGVGVASLCLGWRVQGVNLTGLELQSDYAALARRNSARNAIDLAVIDGDISVPPAALKAQSFHHVITNPPFYRPDSSLPKDDGKILADHETLALGDWIKACLKRLRPRGQFHIIHQADRLPDILSALTDCGGVQIRPIAARTGRPAKRVMISARKDSKSPAVLHAPLIMHAAAQHTTDREDFTPVANRVLRDGQAIIG